MLPEENNGCFFFKKIFMGRSVNLAGGCKVGIENEAGAS